MKLFEHEDFEQAILRAAERFAVSEQFVEKDYYVTEILRIVANELGDRATFKGGTSLSKGWGLTTRFSEDIDLFLNPEMFTPRPGKKRIDRILKELAEAVGEHAGLTWLRDEGQTSGGLGREDYFGYDSRFSDLPGIRSVVRLEPGVQSGDFPTAVVRIGSLVGQYLREQGTGDIAEDLTEFEMTLLHYRRTFVEKLFAIHGKVVRFLDEGYPIGRDARHFADLYVLAGEDEVRAMLASTEYGEIRKDYDEKSRAFFPKIYRPPTGLTFADSAALFPNPELRRQLAEDYEEQCRLLFSGGRYPSFDEVLARFQEIRHLL